MRHGWTGWVAAVIAALTLTACTVTIDDPVGTARDRVVVPAAAPAPLATEMHNDIYAVGVDVRPGRWETFAFDGGLCAFTVVGNGDSVSETLESGAGVADLARGTTVSVSGPCYWWWVVHY